MLKYFCDYDIVPYIGETGANFIQVQVVTESFYENIAHVWRYLRQLLVESPPSDTLSRNQESRRLN